MTINNPYIDLVKDHPDIIIDTEKMYAGAGKWWDFFEKKNPVYLEIGTGMGNFFGGEVRDNPEINYIGMEIKYKRLYITAEKAHGRKATQVKNPEIWKDGAKNFVLLKGYAQNIDKIFLWEEIDLSYVFFPDPWPKDKHKKHRLLQTDFLNNMYTITKTAGKCIIKTDHREYFDFVLDQLQDTQWKIIRKSYDWEAEDDYDSSKDTEFQKITKKHTEKVNYLELQK